MHTPPELQDQLYKNMYFNFSVENSLIHRICRSSKSFNTVHANLLIATS